MDADLALLDRWCAGDKAAGNELFQRHFTTVCRFFESKTQGEIDELVQETFLACVRRRDEFRRQSTFRTFLFAIARFELYRHWRQRARSGDAIAFETTSLAQLITTPATRLDRGHASARLLYALRELPLESQLLLELHYWEGFDAAQLAEVFDVEPVTARTRLFRARQQLREHLEAAPGGAALVPDFDAWVASMREELQNVLRG